MMKADLEGHDTLNVLTQKQVEQIWDKRGIILAQGAYWVTNDQGGKLLVCPQGCVITCPGFLREEDSLIDKIPEPREEGG